MHAARAFGDAYEHGLLVLVQQPLEHPSAAAQHPVHPVSPRQAKRPARQHLLAHFDQAAQRVLSDLAASRCTSSSNERDPTI